MGGIYSDWEVEKKHFEKCDHIVSILYFGNIEGNRWFCCKWQKF